MQPGTTSDSSGPAAAAVGMSAGPTKAQRQLESRCVQRGFEYDRMLGLRRAQLFAAHLDVETFATSTECIAAVRAAGRELWVTDLAQDALPLSSDAAALAAQLPPYVAVVLGAEATDVVRVRLPNLNPNPNPSSKPFILTPTRCGGGGRDGRDARGCGPSHLPPHVRLRGTRTRTLYPATTRASRSAAAERGCEGEGKGECEAECECECECACPCGPPRFGFTESFNLSVAAALVLQRLLDAVPESRGRLLAM